MSEEAVQNALSLASVVLKHVPFSYGEVYLAYRFAEKTGHLALEILLPSRAPEILNDLPGHAEEQIRGFCESMDENIITREGHTYRVLSFSV